MRRGKREVEGKEDKERKAEEEEEEEGGEEEEEEEKTVVNLLEQPAARHCMDDTAARTAVDYGFEEDNSASNKKLAVGAVACAAVAVSHFAPVPFPESIPLLWACIAVYSVCALYLQYAYFYVEGDALLRTVERQKGLQERQFFPAVVFRADMGRFDPEYKLTARLADGRGTEEELKLSATDFFDTKGAFYHKKFARAVTGLCERIHAQGVRLRPKSE